jgi:hypothetical protein
MITVLNHAPVKAIDYSMIADGIRAYVVSSSDLPDEAITVNKSYNHDRIEFKAGSYVIRCIPSKPQVLALADRIAKHGVKEKKKAQAYKLVAMDQEYTVINDKLVAITREKGGKYKVVKVDGFSHTFIWHKTINSEGDNFGGYSLTICGTGCAAVRRAKTLEEALEKVEQALPRATELNSDIEKHRLSYAAKMLEAGL